MKQVAQRRSSLFRPISGHALARRSGFWLPLTVLIIAATLCAMPRAFAQRAGPPLVMPATADDSARYSQSARRPDTGVSRQRPVHVELPALDDEEKAAATTSVELFDGQSITLTKDRIERRGPGNYTWHGKMPATRTDSR